jgi:hypothetical protein
MMGLSKSYFPLKIHNQEVVVQLKLKRFQINAK